MAFGRLERSAPSQPISDINMTPLIDVMLVLVVILILTAPLLASSLRLDLPSAQAATPAATAPVIAVALDAKGDLYLDERPVTLAGLQAQLKRRAQQTPQAEVQLRVDQAVPYGRVVAILDAAHQASLFRIGFVTEP